MPTPILATKLYIPPPRSKAVLRPRLIERLNEGLDRKMTLITAPPGYGKTTALSDWIPRSERCVAWISLDDGDNDPVRFWAYFVAALQMLDEAIGRNALALLRTPPLPSFEAILTTLLNDIAAFPDDFALVLDDYDVIEAAPIDQALTFLLEHLPPHMHLVVTTRGDPALPLARLRARGQLAEVRASDLRFTRAEAAEFLNSVMDLSLSEADIAALEERTEGWIAGLQLAALSMQGQEDRAGFIRAFTGDHRYIVDYLVTEVLQRQPEGLRGFLLQTSILDRLTGPLCDAVTGQENGQAQLEILERRNFFVVPLDDKRRWYRYHHLFADVLQAHLRAEQPDRETVLHQRASVWFEQNGLMADAIRHALVGADFERAAGLIETAVQFMRQSRQESTLLGWLKAFPDELFQDHPVLHVHLIGTLLQNGQFDGVEARLGEVEQWLATPEEIRERPVYVDEEDFQRLPISVAMYRAAIAVSQGDVANAVKHAHKILEFAREDDDFARGAALALLGLATWTGGDLETAHRMFSEGMAHLQKAGYVSDVIGGAVTLADIRIAQGRLHEAMSIYERGLQLASKPGAPTLRGAADMHVGLSELHRERNDVDWAEQHLLKSMDLGDLIGLPKNPYRWRVAMARIREIQGDLQGALDLLDDAESLYVGDFSPNARPIAALKARLWLKQGELAKALVWAREQKLSVEEDPSYLREFEQITYVRVLLSQYPREQAPSLLQDAMRLLERLLQAAEEGGRMGSAIEILILQALAHQMDGHFAAALTSLERALQLGEPEGYMRIFLDEGAGMAELIRKADGRGVAPNYTRKLAAAFEGERKGIEIETPMSASTESSSLLEPLSQRELEILRLFSTELSGPEIARELVIALSTVRTHTKSIYGKLNVNSRRAAVRRAAELGLI